MIHRQPMREVEEIVAIENRGLQGCAHGRVGSGRQVLLMEAETLEELDLNLAAGRKKAKTGGLAFGGWRGGNDFEGGRQWWGLGGPGNLARSWAQPQRVFR